MRSLKSLQSLFLLSLLFLFALTVSAAGRKSADIPCFYNPLPVKVDGIPNEPFWKKAGVIKDFQRFRRPETPLTASTQVLMCLDKENIYVALICQEPAKIISDLKIPSLWSEDHVDMIFSSIDGEDWFRQIAFSLDGRSYEEFIKKTQYRKAVHRGKGQWSAEVVIPRSCFGTFSKHSLRFNVLRKRTQAKETHTWAPVYWALEPHNQGILHLYDLADEITHGPWLSAVRTNSAVISWETAGRCQGILYWRKAGEKEFKIHNLQTASGVSDWGSKLHHTTLKDLSPDTLYEYHAGDGKIASFRTLALRPGNFSFAFTTDIHGDNDALKKVLSSPLLDKVDFLFLGGDLLTGVTGRYGCYAAFLDTLTTYWKRPAFCFRGNHEYRGYPEYFMELTAPFDRKSYGAFTHKGVFFLYLDSGEGQKQLTDYTKKQGEFLEKVIQSPAFRNASFRILLVHHPLYPEPKWQSSELEYFFKLMKKHKAEQKIDLMLAGHIHSCNSLLPGEKKLKSTNPRLNGKIFQTSVPFPVLTNDRSGLIVVDAQSGKLTVSIYDGKLKKWAVQDFPAKKSLR